MEESTGFVEDMVDVAVWAALLLCLMLCAVASIWVLAGCARLLWMAMRAGVRAAVRAR